MRGMIMVHEIKSIEVRPIERGERAPSTDRIVPYYIQRIVILDKNNNRSEITFFFTDETNMLLEREMQAESMDEADELDQLI